MFSSPKRAINLSTVCGVNDISGTNIKLDFPEFSTLSISCKYISVFPEPVTPNSKNSELN